MWCTKVLWACGMQAEYMCICFTHIRADISVDSTPGLQACDVKCIESDSHSSIYTMFLLNIINVMMNLNQFGHLLTFKLRTINT